ncbi:hypothetical protein M7784_13440 [Desulfovibrio aminophilus]|nr:hypothetical protein [Desulfovibrio aminophilus]MCM0756238.1 hypothetical protein [Desulfovibrio aminophilus]
MRLILALLLTTFILVMAIEELSVAHEVPDHPAVMEEARAPIPGRN